ncbi:hypothetical protein O9X98_06550 [Agrobacterium salinitolerans]|nr:hypothetical protein [Agrobacterium salinitolerans]
MTNQIKRDDLFLGLPLTKLKTLLQLFENDTRHPAAVGRSSKLKLSSSLATAMIGESRIRDLISFGLPDGAENGPRKWRRSALTPAGEAIVTASARKRATKAAAGKVLHDILVRTQCLSVDKRAPLDVEKIWVFGSFVDPSKTDVGDLDIVVEERRKPEFVGKGSRAIATHIDKHYPGVVPESIGSFHSAGHFLRRMVYGAKKHPLVSPCDIDTLIELHRPCRLVFDRERGGVIPPEDFCHHPSSTERSDNIRERLVMPDLAETPESFSFTPAEVVSNTFFGWKPKEEIIITDTADIPVDLRGAVEGLEFDGLRRFGVVVRPDNGTPAVVIVERTLRTEASNWLYDCKVSIRPSGRQSSLDQCTLERVADVVGDLFNSDIIRLADRRDRLDVYPDIVANVEVEGPGKLQVSKAIKPRVFELGRYSEETQISPRHQFGLEVVLNRETDAGFAPICSYDENDWLEIGAALPFTEAKYNEWIAKNDPARYEQMQFFAASAGEPRNSVPAGRTP